MSFTSEYLKLREKRKKEEKENIKENSGVKAPLYVNKTAALYADSGDEDIAPVTTKTTTKAKDEEKEEERTWFQKGAFEDGYQFGDVAKTILGVGQDISENVYTGILGMGEKAVDAGAYVVGGVGGLLGADKFKDEMGEFIAKDLYDEEKVAKALTKPTLANILGGSDNSILGEKSDSLLQSGGQLAATVGLQAVGVPWFVTSGVTAFGSEVEGAFNEGAGYGAAGLSAAISAGAEILTEKISGGIKFGGKTLDDALVKSLSTSISNKAVRTMAKLGLDVVGEGSEEVISQVFSNLGSALYKDESIEELLASEEAVDEYIESFIGGAVLGGGMGGVNAIQSKSKGVDYASGLTASEESVVKKIYEDRIAEAEKDGELTNKQKSKIYDEVLEDMEKGGFSTDTIEEVLGGESYKAYKDAVDNEAALRKEYTELYRMKNGEKSDEQIDRQAELKKQLDELNGGRIGGLKTKLDETMYGVVNGSRLAESYNERARRTQKFEADLTQYDEKQRAVIQKAVDSGILNNTRRTREFVDMIAKISADKGVSFDFTNNQRLKESGFAVDGKQVNGFIKDGNVTLNINSAKSLNTVVGHEISHVLEGTELYGELQKAVYDYANKKGEYQVRREGVENTYSSVKDADIDSELTADLIGDYLFTDSDFVRNLSTEHRNVFQKIYDEIKYLCKVATAGSKEARQLERVKKAFEDAYRTGSKAPSGVKHNGVIFKNIHDNGGYSNGTEGASTVAIAFDSNQIKSVANESPTPDSDIRYSLSRNTELMDNAENYNNNNLGISLDTARQQRQEIYDFMMRNADRLKMPEDIEGNTAIKNSSYDITEENTTVCIRSMAADALCDAVAEELGRPLTVEDTIRISQDLMNYTDAPECVYCYVATDRRAYREFLGSYHKQMTSAVEALKSGKNSAEVYEAFLDGRKDTKNMRNRFAMWEEIANGGKMISEKDLASEKMMQNAMRDPELAAQVKDARAYAQSASWAKKRQGYQAYDGHILKWSQRRVNDLNKHYGLRFYSFSDFSPAFVLENMQQMTDAAVRGLKGLAYTKELDFVEIFAPTDVNINISVFGYDQNGVVAQDGMMGADWARAQELRNKYENVGITFVATNDTQIEWALNQDWIDVVIPYHLVRTGQTVAKHFGYTNYTAESADTKGANWKKGDKRTIYPSEHNNDKQTYLDAIAKANLEPRFARWVEHPNYMKLVNETRRAANDTPRMKAEFNVEAAKASLERMAKQGGYFVPIGGDYANMQDIAGDIANDIRAKSQYSLSDANETPRDYGGWNVYGKDIMLPQDEVAPVGETVPAPKVTTPVMDRDDLYTEDVAPISEEDAVAFNQENFDSLTDEDAPYEAEEDPYDVSYGMSNAELSGTGVDDNLAPDGGHWMSKEDENPFHEREWSGIGNRKVKAYMYENPEVKPFFQEEAAVLLDELGATQKGERWYFYDEGAVGTGGDMTVGGTKRHTSQSIETMLDGWGMSYADIEKGLKAIIKDNGAENIAAAKKIEFMLNDRLYNGYKDFFYGENIPPNQDYIDLVNANQVTAYSKENFDNLMANLDAYGISEEMTADIAPAAQTQPEAYEAIRPKRNPSPNPPRKEPRMARATPAEQARASVLVEEPQTEKKKRSIWSKFKNNVLDKGMIFEDLSLKTGNRELQARWNSIRYAEGKAQRFMENGNSMSNSLKNIREEVESTGKTQQFYEYLYHKHNISRMTLAERYADTENKPVFGYDVTAEVSREAVAELEKANPEFTQFAQDVYDYMNALREMLVEGGVISRETARVWAEMYPHYVPIRRVGDDGLNINVPLDTGRTGVNAPIKRATGGSRDILPLFETMALRTEQTFKAVAKNRFGVELKNTLGTTIDSEAMGIDEAIDSIDTQDGLLQEGKNGRSPTFTVFDNGEKVTFEITNEMYDAIKPTSEGMAYTNKVLNTASNIRRGMITEYNPWFLLKNAVKDVQDVLVNSQHAARTYAAIPKAINQMATNGQWYQEYLDNGGERNTYFEKETHTFKAKNKVLDGLNFIGKANNIVEMLPRLAEYIASREAGQSVDVAMLDAARVTTNFAAGGDLTKLLNRNGATFLNASVQGAMQQVRNIREAKMNGLRGWANLAGKFVAAGLPALLLNHLIWDDDEEYEELSDYVKQNYYIVGKYGDGKFVRIPKGRTVSVIQDAFEQMEHLVTGDDEADLKGFLDLVITNLAPNNPIDNNIFSPIAQVAANKTWYGEDLVPTRLQKLPKAQQYDESTDAISKWLGENTNTSPYKWNYLIDQYSGVLGDTFLPMLTPEAESGDNSLVGNLIAPLKDMFTTDSVMKNQNVTDFYDTKEKLTTNANSDTATDEDALMSKYMNAVNADLADLYQKKREIQNSNLSDKEKYAAVRKIQEEITFIANDALETYEDVRIDGGQATVGDRHYHLNKDGEWEKTTAEQLAKYQFLEDYGVSYEDYMADEDTKEEYDSVYSWYKNYPDKVTVSRAVTDNVIEYRRYTSALNDLHADKDSSGKSISGSRKDKVFDYINGLDIDYGAKCILFKSEYNADDTYNEDIFDYLNGRDDLSYEEKLTIMRELGFTVSSDGTITW